MRVGIIGGGISGLSAAYYLRKFSLPVKEIYLFEASSRFGGWMESKKVQVGEDTVYFEKGPRTLRLSTGEPKELNSLKLAIDMGLEKDIDLISKDHPASKNRYIYLNNKINVVKPKIIGKSELLPKGLLSYLWKEYRTAPRDASIEDESIYSFISRRLGENIAENIIDPVFKGICGGDIKYLSANSFIKKQYDYERKYGSITRGILSDKKKSNLEDSNYEDLREMSKYALNQSVWRIKNGMQQMSDRLVQYLSQENNNVKLYLNEHVERVEFESDSGSSVRIKTKSMEQSVDLVISNINAKYNCAILPDKYEALKSLLNKIDSVNMVVVNMYFKEDILPVKGFGYLVPTNQNSPILGCIFDSIFNQSSEKNTVLTIMMGGAWYDQYIGSKDSNQIAQMAYDELSKHLNIKTEPDYYEVSKLKDAIPQYRVGHQQLVNDIRHSLVESGIGDRLYLNGYSYDGVGVNDSIFNSRKLVQNVLSKHPRLTNA